MGCVKCERVTSSLRLCLVAPQKIFTQSHQREFYMYEVLNVYEKKLITRIAYKLQDELNKPS